MGHPHSSGPRREAAYRRSVGRTGPLIGVPPAQNLPFFTLHRPSGRPGRPPAVFNFPRAQGTMTTTKNTIRSTWSMKKLSLLALCLTALFSFSVQVQADPGQFNVLLYTKMEGFHHKAVNEGVQAMRQMAQKHHFNIDWHEDANMFSDERLARYDAIVFLMTTGDVLNEDQRAAMKRFIQSGNGFVGIHSASDTLYGWEWYTKLVGRMFRIHPVIQTAELQVVDRAFPKVERMPERFLWTDEYYDFGPELTDNLNYILIIDESTYEPAAKDRKSTRLNSSHVRI